MAAAEVAHAYESEGFETFDEAAADVSVTVAIVEPKESSSNPERNHKTKKQAAKPAKVNDDPGTEARGAKVEEEDEFTHMPALAPPPPPIEKEETYLAWRHYHTLHPVCNKLLAKKYVLIARHIQY
jgi:hypothetical protein